MIGEAVSMTGTWMQVMAQNWVMTTLTSSAMMLGWVTFAAGVPMIALTMIGGSFADRYDRRRILLLTQLVQIVFALALGWLVATERVQIWHVIGIAFLLGISNSFEMPSAAALVPELVPRQHVATAIAIDRSIFHGTRLIGPALAGYVVGLWGTASAFYLNAFSFLAMILALFTLHPRPQGSAEEEAQRRSGMKEGLAYVRSDRPTMGMIALMAATTVFVFPVMVVMLPLYARNVLLLGADKMGLLMGLSGIGSFTASISLLAVTAATVALVCLSRAHRFSVAAGSLILLSLGVSTLIGLANTIVQERAPSPLRGRVSAVAGLSFFGLMPLASLGMTSVADWLGLRTTLLVSAALYLSTAIPVLVATRLRPSSEATQTGRV